MDLKSCKSVNVMQTDQKVSKRSAPSTETLSVQCFGIHV